MILTSISFAATVTKDNLVTNLLDTDIIPIGTTDGIKKGVVGIEFQDFKKLIQSELPYDLNFAVTGEGESLATATDKIIIYAPRDFKLKEIGYSLATLGSGVTNVNITVKKNGSTANAYVLPSIVSIQYNTLATAIDFSKGDAIGINIAVTATTPPKGLKIYLIGETV